jgi:hypothetical protein
MLSSGQVPIRSVGNTFNSLTFLEIRGFLVRAATQAYSCFMLIFICGLFNDAVNSLDYKRRMIGLR